MKTNNPFITIGYQGPEYFCDRETETKKILDYLENGWNITLSSPRRMGKTGLIHHVFRRLKELGEKKACIYTDIYSTINLNDFVSLFSKSVFSSLGTPTAKLVKRLTTLFRSCRPFLTVDPNNGMPEIRLDFAPAQAEQALQEIFDFLKTIETDCYIAIDEFQQVSEYPEKNVEALIRTHIQNLANVRFIFAGSKSHLIEEMFLTAKRPFYQSTRMVSLDVIPTQSYFEFAKHFFDEIRVSLPASEFENLYNMVDGHTWYVQSILNQLYMDRPKNIDGHSVMRALNAIVEENNYTYQRFFSMLTGNQRMMLRAVAKERIVAQPTSSQFLTRYGLKAGSSVMRSINSLLENEYIYKDQRGIMVYDRFFGIWLAQL